MGRLLVVERERDQRRRVVLLLETRGATIDGLEKAVRAAAATARTLSGRGLEVGLAQSEQFLPPASGLQALTQILRELAVARPSPGSGPAPDAHGEASIHFGGRS